MGLTVSNGFSVVSRSAGEVVRSLWGAELQLRPKEQPPRALAPEQTSCAFPRNCTSNACGNTEPCNPIAYRSLLPAGKLPKEGNRLYIVRQSASPKTKIPVCGGSHATPSSVLAYRSAP